MYTEKTKKDCNDFLNKHLASQLACMVISQEVNAAGYPGFGWMFQIQSMDEVAHQRRVINYLQNTPNWDDYKLESPKVESFGIKTPVEAVETWLKIRTEMMELAETYRDNARNEHDEMSAKFYVWFIQDGWSEIDEYSDLRDRLKMQNADWGHFDLRANKTDEINLDNVIHPMKSFIIED